MISDETYHSWFTRVTMPAQEISRSLLCSGNPEKLRNLPKGVLHVQKACESGSRVSLDHHFRALFECFSRDSISRRKICKKEGQDSCSRVFNFRDLFTIAKKAKWRTRETPLCNRPSGIYILTGFSKKTSLGWLIFQWGFLTWVLPIKPHLYRYENWRRTRRFTLFFMWEWLPVPFAFSFYQW